MTPAQSKETDGWKTAEPKDDAIRGKWWEMFGDTNLNALEEQVNISNQTVAAAFANFLSARAVVKQARFDFFPTVGVNPSVTRWRTTSINSRNDLTYSEYSLPLDASWEPDFWGSIRNTYKADKFEAQATLADLENTRLTVQSELAADYITLRSLDSQKELLDSTVHAYRDSLALTRVLHKRVAESVTHHEEACGRNQLGQPARESCPNSTVTCCGLSLFVKNCRKALDRRTEP